MSIEQQHRSAIERLEDAERDLARAADNRYSPAWFCGLEQVMVCRESVSFWACALDYDTAGKLDEYISIQLSDVFRKSKSPIFVPGFYPALESLRMAAYVEGLDLLMRHKDKWAAKKKAKESASD